MATLKNKRKLTAKVRETQEHPRNNQSQNSAAPGITEVYIAQVSEEIEGRVTKKLSQEFSKTVSRILGALSKLGDILLNPQIRTFSGTTPGTFRNNDVENQEPSGDRSQNDPHPEVGFSACRASNLTDSDPEETSHRNSCGFMPPMYLSEGFERDCHRGILRSEITTQLVVAKNQIDGGTKLRQEENVVESV